MADNHIVDIFTRLDERGEVQTADIGALFLLARHELGTLLQVAQSTPSVDSSSEETTRNIVETCAPIISPSSEEKELIISKIQSTPALVDVMQQAITLINAPSVEGAQTLMQNLPSALSALTDTNDLEGQGMVTSLAQALNSFFSPVLEPPTLEEKETMEKDDETSL